MANEPEKDNETIPNPDVKQEPEKKEEQKAASASDLESRIKQLEAENGRLRQANTNASADASSWKKKYQEKLSEEDRKKEEQEEQTATLQKELETLRAERNVANFKSQLTAPDIGFDAVLAQEVAEAMNTGDNAKVFDGLRRFIVAHDKSLRESAFKNNPVLPGGSTQKAVSKEQFDRMGYKERLEVFNSHPDLYQEYTR